MPGLLSPLFRLDPPPAESKPLADERRRGAYARRHTGVRREPDMLTVLGIVGLTWAALVALEIAGMVPVAWLAE